MVFMSLQMKAERSFSFCECCGLVVYEEIEEFNLLSFMDKQAEDE